MKKFNSKRQQANESAKKQPAGLKQMVSNKQPKLGLSISKAVAEVINTRKNNEC